MTLPTAPQIGSTGFVQQPGIAEQVAPFLQMLLQKQELELRKERLKLDKQEMESRLSQQALDAQNQAALGQGLLQSLLQTETMPTPQGFNLGPTFPQQMTGITPIGLAATQLPKAVVPAFVEQTRDMRAQAATARAEAQQLAEFERGLQEARPEHRPILSAMLAFKRSGLNLTEGQINDLFPELKGALQVMTAQDLNAVMSSMARAGISFGQGRRALGYAQPVPGIDDALRAPSRLAKPTQMEQRASGYNLKMEGEFPIILGLVEQSGGLSLSGAALTDLSQGKITIQQLASQTTDPVQKQLVGSLMRYITAETYLTSGAQATEQEYSRGLNMYIPFATDDPATREQKLAAFRRSILASRQQGGTAARPSIVLEETLRLAQLQRWNPNIIRAVESQLAEAKRWEADARRQNSLFADDSPTDESNIDERLNHWESLIP